MKHKLITMVFILLCSQLWAITSTPSTEANPFDIDVVKDIDNPNKSVTADFKEIFIKVTHQQENIVWPYYLDLEGKGQDEVIVFGEDKLLILNPNNLKVLHVLKNDSEIDIGSDDDIHFGRIYQNGPYCFWFEKITKVPMAKDMVLMSYNWSYEWFFYSFIDGKWKRVFYQKFQGQDDHHGDDPNNEVGLINGKLKCVDVMARWDKKNNCFVKLPKAKLKTRADSKK